MLNEGNKEDQYLEKKGESTKTTAMRKASSRRHRFDTGTTHQNAKRENITWARPGTRSYDDSLNRQRKEAHRSARKRRKPQAGSSPEDRRWSKFVGDEPEGKYQKLQKAKEAGQKTNIEAQKQGLIRNGERRRELRTQAVNAIRRAVGGGYVSEAKVEKNLSPTEKENVRNQRAYGSTSLRDRATGIRRTFHAAERGVKKEIPTGNEKSEISGRFGTGAEVRREIRKLKGRRSGRDFSKRVRQELEAERYIKQQNSEFAAKNAENKIVRLHREQKTFSEFMWSVYESSGMTPENRETWNRLVRLYGPDPFTHLLNHGPHPSTNSEKPNTKSASRREDPKPKRKPRKLNFEVREENNLVETPFQIYGPDPHGPSDSEPRPLGKPYKNKKRAKNRADELDQEIGGYRHFVRKVDEDFVPLTPEKEERVKKRVGELARDIQVSGARMRELKKKPFGKFRPKVRQEKEAIVKSTRKKVNQVRSASDALIDASTSRSAKIQKRIQDLRGKS